jgi:hypothetical protein
VTSLADRRIPAAGADLPPSGTAGTYGAHDAADLAAMAAAGFGAVRLFASWKAVEPQVGWYDDSVLDALAGTVSDAAGRGLAPIVCLFAVSGTGEYAGPAWSGRRDPHADPYMVERAAAYAAAVAGRLAPIGRLAAWQLADETFLAGFGDTVALRAWAARMVEVLADGDPGRPVTLGADPEVLADTDGLDARPVVERMSLALAAPSPRQTAMLAPGPGLAGPATHLGGFLGRLARKGLPLVADGLAPGSAALSLDEEAGLVRLGLAEALADGACAAFAGRWRGAREGARVPFERATGERLTALVGPDGAATPALAEVAPFAALARAAEGLDLAPAPERVAVLVPSSRGITVGGAEALLALRSSLASFVLAREAHLPVDVVREEDGLEGLAVVIVPGARRLADRTWDALGAFVQEGGTLVLSHGGGEITDAFRSLTGVEYLGEAGPQSVLCCRVAQPEILGETTSFEVPLQIGSSAVLAPGRATVMASDAAGRPLVTVRRSGQGRTYLLSAPLERAIGDLPHDEAPTLARRLVASLYRAAAEQAGAAGPVDCDRAAVRTAVLEGPGGIVLVACNHAPAAVTATITWERDIVSLTPLAGGEPALVGGRSFRVRIGPHGVAALRLDRS